MAEKAVSVAAVFSLVAVFTVVQDEETIPKDFSHVLISASMC
jgi:hypothetical protein